jgi:hypothetical protein
VLDAACDNERGKGQVTNFGGTAWTPSTSSAKSRTVDNVIGRATKAPGAEDFGILRALVAVWSRENPGGRISGRRSATP